MKRLVHILLCTLTFAFQGLAQDQSVSNFKINLPHKVITIGELVTLIEDQSDYFVSYNTQLDLSETLEFESTEVGFYDLKKSFTTSLFATIEIDSESKKLIILPPKFKTLHGIVRDSANLETLTAVTILSDNNKGTTTNEDGFFYLKVSSETKYVYVSYLGYRTLTFAIPDKVENEVIIHLIADNVLPDIVIEASSAIEETISINPHDVKIDKESPVRGIGGRSDLISSIRHISGISVGSEAQNGFTVRGGGPDQNLVLLDGLPVYETSHLGGLSSIFVDNIIKKGDLYKGGVPARFGGKLSSVLDIRLKEGNRHQVKREAEINLENFSGFIEGPIGKKTSFIFNGRKSIINSYSNFILKRFLDFEDSDLTYNDIYSKITHWFSPANRLSLSVYSGDDKIFLRRNESSTDRVFTDSNKVNWSNTLGALNWNSALGKKVFIHGHVGKSDFDFNSRSANQVIETSDLDSSSLAINVYSRQQDYTAKLDLDYYTNNLGKIKTGGGIILHESSPSILESQSLTDQEIAQDTSYLSNEIYFFLENELRINSNWSLNSGLRYNYHGGLDTTYQYFQPRLNMHFAKNRIKLDFAYNRMSQFLHLLVNPSSGLPSDLWVPSTKKIEPETSNLFSISGNYKASPSLLVGLGGFYNTYSNLIEYSNPYEIIQVIVGNHLSFNQDISDVNWEDRVTVGTGRSYGLELDIAYKTEKIELNLAYTLSRSERTFNFGKFSKNEIETFPYKYDRPHNIAFSGSLKLKKDNKINVEWLYGNGNTWTFTDNVIPGQNGEIIYQPRPGERNNERLSSYQRLSISHSSKRQLRTGGLLFYTMGVYNVYNNKNPFYAYIKSSDTNAQVPVTTEISLYPVFPQINVGYQW